MVNTHHLEIQKPSFQEIKKGIKQFEVLKSDRDYQIGDTLILNEYDPVKKIPTGAWVPESITYKLDDTRYLKDGYIVLGMQEIKF